MTATDRGLCASGSGPEEADAQDDQDGADDEGQPGLGQLSHHRMVT
jgi:hypothetical protein